MKKKTPFRWYPPKKRRRFLPKKRISLIAALASIKADDPAEIRMLKRELFKRKSKRTHPGRRFRLRKKMRDDDAMDGG